jgi:uncharacterized protein YbjT (DUF2867 family)
MRIFRLTLAMMNKGLFAIFVGLCALFAGGCAGGASGASAGPQVVLVAGATGGTGRTVVTNLRAQGYRVRAFVRNESKARVVLGDDIEYVTGDVRQIDSIRPAVEGATYVISAIGSSRTDPTNNPEAVDYMGVRNLANASAEAGVSQFVLVSSTGATQEDHFLNKTFDNILKWKFAGEEALRASGVPYTIVRPGGLVNTPGNVDAVIFAQGDTSTGRISREDLAMICVAALRTPASINRTFEAYSSEEPGENNWADLYATLQAD